MTRPTPDPADAPLPADCLAAVRRLWDFLDEELGPADARAVRAHLDGCANCSAHARYLRGFLRAVANAAHAAGCDPDAAEVARLRGRIRAALRVEAHW